MPIKQLAALGAAFALLAVCPLSRAQLPVTRLEGIFPAAAQREEVTEVRIDGQNLDDVDRLVFSHPGIQAVAVTGSPAEFDDGWAPYRDRFRIEVSPDVPEGMYDVRAVGRYGISNPRTLQVSARPVATEPSAAHSQPEQAVPLKVNVHMFGRSDPSQYDWYQFHCEDDGPVSVACDSSAFESSLRPAIVVLDADRHEIDRVFGPQAAITTFRGQAGADYWIGVHDQIYRGGSAFLYRLIVSPSARVVSLIPPVVQQDRPDCLKLLVEERVDRLRFTRHLADQSVCWNNPSHEQTTVSRMIESFGRPGTRVPLANAPAFSPVVIGVTDLPLIAESPDEILSGTKDSSSKDEVTPITIPCEVSGTFFPHADVDTFQFQASQGDVLWIDVLSHRLGRPTHPRLIVQRIDESGHEPKLQRVAIVDDFQFPGVDPRRMPINPQSRDPRYRLEVPKTGVYQVSVYDLFSEARDDPTLNYRIQIRPPRPDFTLISWFQESDPQNNRKYQLTSPVLRAGESLVLTVAADRLDGMDQGIHLEVEGLPDGVACRPETIQPGSNVAQLVVTAKESSAAWTGEIRVIGTSTIDGKQLVHHADVATMNEGTEDLNNDRPNSRLCQNLMLSVIDCEPMPVVVQFGEAPWSEQPVSGQSGKELVIPVTVKRQEGFGGQVDLNVRGLPGGASADNLQIPQDQNQGTVTIKWDKPDVPAGPHRIYLDGKTTGKYSRNQQVVSRLKMRREAFQRTLEQLRTAASQDTEAAKKLERAEAYDKLLESQLKTAEDQNKATDLPIRLVSNSLAVLAPNPPEK